MHPLVSFDGEIRSHSYTPLCAVSSASLYAKGVFTTIRIGDHGPFLWDKHWHRLSGAAALLGIDLAEFSDEYVRNCLAELTRKNNVQNGRARVTFLDETSSSIWPFDSDQKTRLLITTSDLRPEPSHFRLSISPHTVNSRSPLAGIKSCNYMEKILTLDEAKRRGFGEAIQLNERGNIASACMANIFWLVRGVLFTPSVRTGCVPGTTREFVMENLECSEVETGIESLEDADAIFLTSAGIGVRQVSEYNGRRLPETGHAILSLIP